MKDISTFKKEDRLSTNSDDSPNTGGIFYSIGLWTYRTIMVGLGCMVLYLAFDFLKFAH
jgi:hypothetical protein